MRVRQHESEGEDVAHTGVERREHPDTCAREKELSELISVVGRIKADLYNGDDDPEKGLVPEIRAWLVEERADRRRRWKRSDKISAIAICTVLLSWPSAQVITFVRNVSAIVQEWHDIKGNYMLVPVPEKKDSGQPGAAIHHKSLSEQPDQSVSSKQLPQDAGNSAAYTAAQQGR